MEMIETTPATEQKRHVKKRVSEGIYLYRNGYSVRVQVGHLKKERRYRIGTRIREMQLWRKVQADMMRRELQRLAPIPEPLLKRSPNGWCYIYVIQSTAGVKIGRAVEPSERLKELQTSHHEKLEVVALVPGYAALEGAIHERFAHLRMVGEWFQVTDELRAFIEGLRAGKNPVALLWDC